MSNKKYIYLELIIVLLFILSTFYYIRSTFKILNDGLSNLNAGGSISVTGLIVLNLIIYVLFFLFILTCYLYIIKKQKKLQIVGITVPVLKKIMKHRIISGLTFILIILILFLLVIYFFQDKFLYYPNHSRDSENQLIATNEYTKLTINCSNDEVYSGWAKVDQQKKNPTILYFGGNAQSSARMFWNFQRLEKWYTFDGLNFIMIDYPGYGLSKGIPAEKSILLMAESVYDYISTLEYVDEDNIVILGYSLWTGIATYISSIKPVAGLILIAPYTNITDIFNNILGIFHGPMKWLIKNKFDSTKYAPDIEVVPLIIASKADETIKIKISKKLSEYFVEEPKIIIVEDKLHNDILDDDLVLLEIRAYLQKFLNC